MDSFLTQAFIPALAAIAGALLGFWFATIRDRNKARLSFCERQLREFYSPRVGIRREISALSEFRNEMANAADELWREEYALREKALDKAELMKSIEPDEKLTKSRIEFDNTQLENKLLPRFHQMLDLFRNNYWLAKPGTQEHFTTLVQFVDHWDRFLSETHPPELLQKTSISEGALTPFYEHLNSVHDDLRSQIEAGVAKGKKGDESIR